MDRFYRIKDKINHPPEKNDYQKVSHKLADFIKLKEGAKTDKQVIRERPKEDKPGKILKINIFLLAPPKLNTFRF